MKIPDPNVSHHSPLSDVGGGAVENVARNALARIPLRWMVRQCFLAETGIMFDAKLLPEIGLDPSTLFPKVLPRPDLITFENADHSRIARDRSSGTVTVVDEGMILAEEEEDLVDILCPINDQLSQTKTWWLLEILPLIHWYQKKDGCWVTRRRCVRLHTRGCSELLITHCYQGQSWQG